MDPGLMLTIAPELRPFRPQVEAYANAKIQRFAYMFANRLNLNITKEQIDYVTAETMHNMAAMQEPIQMMPQQNLRLVLRHDCLSSGCGDNGCSLCQYNPSRICKRNLKQKYLIDDHLRAKCGAGLRVEVVDENGQCVSEPVPDMELEVHMLNGEKYKEVCPDNTLLNNAQLRGCIIQANHKKPLLKRESAMGVAEDTRIFLTVEHGQAPLSDLQCTTSSEALLCGKAPTFRLLVWAIDRASGTPVPNVTYVVSESFVVATKRVKHAIKSDIPSIGDHISKLVHIGKATVDKLQDIRQAAVEENLDLELPEELNRVDKVGQFRQLVELTEKSSDLKHKLRHLLKLSPEKWEEVSQHALSAVVPDFRPRVWWYPGINGALLFACKNGAVLPEHPVAYVTKDGGSGVEGVTPIQQVDAFLFNLLPKLKQQAMQDWFAPGHTGWAVFWRDPNDPLAQQMQPGPNGPGYMQQLPLGISAAAALGSAGAEQMAAAVGGMAPSAAQMGGGGAGMMPQGMQGGMMQQQAQQMQGMVANGGNQQLAAQMQQQQQQQPLQYQQQPHQQQYAQVPPQAMQQQQQLQSQQQAQMQAQQQQAQLQQQQQQQAQLQAQQQAQAMQQQQQMHQQGQSMLSAPKHPASAPSTATAAVAAAAAAGNAFAPPVPPVSVPLPGQQRHSVPGYGTARSPFATQNLQHTLSAAFPTWQGGLSPGSTPGVSGGGAPPGVSGGGAPPGAVQQQPQQQQVQQQQAQAPASNGNTPAQQQQIQQQQQMQQQQAQQQQQYAMQPPQQQQQYAMQPPQQQQQQQQAGGQGAAAAGAVAGSGPEQSKLAQALPSLEMLNTDDLPPIDRNNSLWPLDSFQQQMQMLAELPSVGVGSMLAVAGVGGGAQGRMGGTGQPGQQMGGANGLDDQPDRALSLKFSMSLDLEEVPKELRSGGSGN